MTTLLSIEHQRVALRDLERLATERARAEVATATSFSARNEATEKEYQEANQRITARFESDKEGVEKEFTETRQAVATRFETEHAITEKEFNRTRRRIAEQYDAAKDKTKTEFKEARWTLTTVYEEGKKKVKAAFQKTQRRITRKQQELDTLQQEARRQLEMWDLHFTDSELALTSPAESRTGDPLAKAQEYLAEGEEQFLQLRELKLPVYCKGSTLCWLVAFGWSVLMLPLLLLEWYFWLAASIVGSVALGVTLRAWLRGVARTRVLNLYRPVCQAVAAGEIACKRARDLAMAAFREQMSANKRRRDDEWRQIERKYRPLLTKIKQRRETEARQANEKYPRLLAEIKHRYETDLRLAEEKHNTQQTEAQDRYTNDAQQAQDKHARLLAESTANQEQEWTTLANNWRQGMACVHETFGRVKKESSRLFPIWDSHFWNQWLPAQTIPPALRFGEFDINQAEVPDGIPGDPRLQGVGPDRFSQPALLPFPENCSLLFKASDAGRAVAVQAFQTLMLRLLTALPPGKVRFTIIDPVGLGENFAAFMHLADYEEALVTSRIWTEQQHIEQCLADLTAHMETVIQKYLRNQFQTIADYNAQAGEVAEPFRILVVANFPVNFSAEAARRLVSIASSGAGCGVYTLVSVDTKQALPDGFHLKDLEQCSNCLVWKDQQFGWKDNDFGKYPLRLDTPPDADFCTRLLRVIGEQAKDASRVEVPFDFLAPGAEQWWTSDSRGGIRVPLGRAGATKRQYLQLGQGTAQHMLIAGKTGSGKSTLLHVLITNLALHYSPDEVELYLVDFKKGVEFKTYATHELPHARVVAIESEREFGLSVLQRLDAELKRRGERFRDLRVQDVKAYREANGKTPCPRILLIVDEFQEFFVEDDKIAQEAALLLDRLVRQGRAFGLHIVLGSQTLGGAYSLARSTIDQMAVRIALQCSEADACLILSKDNAAARLLSRPGEAIYNDANGLVEGNDFFQVVWLPDSRREQLLQRVRDLAHQRQQIALGSRIVFEGNVPADVSANHLLQQRLLATTPPADEQPHGAGRAVRAWLGEAMAIKDPTAAVFRPQSGCNLLMIGQDDEATLAIFTAALVSLAAQQPMTDARFFVLDGTPVDSPHAGYLNQLTEVLPHSIKVAGWRDLPAILNEVAAEVERRRQLHDLEGPALYLFIYGLHRFRDLRRGEDDYGFSRRGADEPPSPDKQFADILREGPGVGVYTAVWCDTLNNVNRFLDRPGLREFEMRILFQMGAADSSTLIDSPLASKLGVHRALFHSEDRGQVEKFRPYGLPSADWLASVRQRLHDRQG